MPSITNQSTPPPLLVPLQITVLARAVYPGEGPLTALHLVEENLLDVERRRTSLPDRGGVNDARPGRRGTASPTVAIAASKDGDQSREKLLRPLVTKVHSTRDRRGRQTESACRSRPIRGRSISAGRASLRSRRCREG
jgi:hypothetical protein